MSGFLRAQKVPPVSVVMDHVRGERDRSPRAPHAVAGNSDPPAVPDVEKAKPEPNTQRNFTDSDSRIMPDGANKGSFIQGYNAQIAVDDQAQIIVALDVVQAPNDRQQLEPMLEPVEQNVRIPQVTSADAGYFGRATIEKLQGRAIELLVPPNRQAHGEFAVVTTAGFPRGVDDRTDASQGPERCGCRALSPAQGDRGAGLRTNQKRSWAAPLSAPGSGPRAAGVSPNRAHPQHAQTASPLRCRRFRRERIAESTRGGTTVRGDPEVPSGPADRPSRRNQCGMRCSRGAAALPSNAIRHDGGRRAFLLPQKARQAPSSAWRCALWPRQP